MSSMPIASALDAQRLAALIGEIYDCVIDPDRWPATISHIRQALGFATAEIAVLRLPCGAPMLSTTSGIAPEWLPRFEQERTGGLLELWGGAERIQQFPLAEPMVLSHAIGRDVLQCHSIYRNFAEPLGISDLVSIALLRNPRAVAGFGLGWPAQRGDIGEQHLAALRLLAPHLRRAVTILRLLDVERSTAASFAQTLDLLPTAVLLVDASLGIVHSNEAGQALLDQRDVMLPQAQQRLRLPDPAAQAALAQAVAQASTDGAALGQRGIGIPLARDKTAPPLVAHVLPLQTGELADGLWPRAVAAIFVADAAATVPMPRQALALLYDLTPAETRVLELLVAGSAPKDIARQLGLAPSTVKTHLLRVFSKTGCRRQADLVRLVASLAV